MYDLLMSDLLMSDSTVDGWPLTDHSVRNDLTGFAIAALIAV